MHFSLKSIVNYFVSYFLFTVIAIDIDSKKIDLAQNNARVYGVADKIEFIVGDFFQLADILKADVVFLSPPWGGPAYLSQPVYELEELLQPVPLSQLLAAARKISLNVAAFLPKNSNTYAVSFHHYTTSINYLFFFFLAGT